MSTLKLSGVTLVIVALVSMFTGIFIGGLIIIINIIFKISLPQTMFFLKSFGIAFVVCFVIGAIIVVKDFIMTKRLSDIFKSQGNSEEYIAELRRQIEHEKLVTKKAKLQLMLASNLEQNRDYQGVFDTVKSIKFDDLSNPMAAKYYSDIVYYYTMTNQLENAQYVYKLGEKYIEKYCTHGVYASSISYNIGVFQYAMGNIIRAESSLLLSKGLAKNKIDKINCDLFLGLIYVNTNRKEYAKNVVLDNISQIGNKRHKEDVTKLINRVELAYMSK